MTTDPATPAYGIIFVGPPGQFSVWTATPHGKLMDRETVERLGQMAALAGAADYRVFELDQSPTQAAHQFMTAEQIATYEPLLHESAGVPPDSGPTIQELITDN